MSTINEIATFVQNLPRDERFEKLSSELEASLLEKINANRTRTEEMTVEAAYDELAEEYNDLKLENFKAGYEAAMSDLSNEEFNTIYNCSQEESINVFNRERADCTDGLHGSMWNDCEEAYAAGQEQLAQIKARAEEEV